MREIRGVTGGEPLDRKVIGKAEAHAIVGRYCAGNPQAAIIFKGDEVPIE